jgi:putative ABC transport system ATP-binding protein
MNEHTEPDASVRLENVSKYYETAAQRVTALENLSWAVKPGEAVALMGPSGCGKSTILNLLGGMDRPTKGGVFAGGRDVGTMSERQLEDYRLRKVGFVFQFFNLIPSLSALENLELPMLMAGMAAHERKQRAEDLLDSVGLKAKGYKRPEELSGGEQQRVAVCLALVNDPPIILADEPTASLDDPACGVVADLLAQAASETGAALVIATHDSRLKARFPLTTDVEPLHE